ncbi:MAG: histidine kinase [Eggerthellaceae bacterium]|nr:histidine kinase [Eggerthellaceae bacterium]
MVPRPLSLEMLTGLVALIAAGVLIWAMFSAPLSIPLVIAAGLIFTISVAIIIRLLLDPDSIRARQTDSMLQLSSLMVDLTSDGLDMEAAQRICQILLPSTQAIAVAITDRETILGYAGYMEAENPSGAKIRTQATHDVIAEGVPRAIYTRQDIGLPEGSKVIQAAIIIPLTLGREIFGTLKFYYRSARRITETQKSIAQGFGTLLSTQIAAAELEQQRDLATAMELKMLQNQINPHFLFNTINTIASLIRTDPAKARVLLRDFAVFYRSTLENSQDRIQLARELEQTQRYFSFEVARFGEDRLAMQVDLGPHATRIEEMLVPPFLLQPLVENAVKHAMPASGLLSVRITASVEDGDVLVNVADDGVGMDAETRDSMMHPKSDTGLGIAVKNVHDRMHGFYGESASMTVVSEPGEGTTVTLRFPDEANNL